MLYSILMPNNKTIIIPSDHSSNVIQYFSSVIQSNMQSKNEGLIIDNNLLNINIVKI